MARDYLNNFSIEGESIGTGDVFTQFRLNDQEIEREGLSLFTPPDTFARDYSAKTAYLALGEGEEVDLVGLYNQIYGEVSTTGNSPTGKDILDRFSTHRYEDVVAATTAQIMESPEAGSLFLQTAAIEVNEPKSYTQLFLEKVVDDEMALNIDMGADDIDSHSQVLPMFNDYIEAARERQALFNSILADGDPSTGGALIDIAELALVPFAMRSASIRDALENEFPDVFQSNPADSISGWLFQGDTKEKIRLILQSASAAELREMGPAIRKAFNKAGWVDQNDVARMFNALDILANEPVSDTEKLIDNVGGILEALFIGAPAMAGARLVRARAAARGARVLGAPHPTSVFGLTEETVSYKQHQMFQNMTFLDVGGQQIADVLAGNPAVIIHNTLPKPANAAPFDLAGAPADLVAAINRMDEAATDVANTQRLQQGRTIPLDQRRSQVQEWTTRLENPSSGAHLMLSKSRFRIDPDNVMVFDGIYGKTDSLPYTSVKEAQDAMLKNFKWAGADFSNLTYFTKRRDGTWKELTQQQVKDSIRLGARSPTYVRFSTTRSFDPRRIHAFSSDDVGSSLIDKVLGINISNYLRDASARISEPFLQTLNNAVDRGFAVEARIAQLGIEPLRGLSKTGQAKVLRALEEGASNQKVYSYAELRNDGLSTPEIEAYFSFRNANDLVWNLQNLDFHTTLSREKYMRYTWNGGGSAAFARPLSSKALTSRLKKNNSRYVYAYDPDTNAPVRMERSDIDNYYKTNGDFAVGFLRQPDLHLINNQWENVQYVLLKQGPGKSLNKIGPTDHVLTYIPGYIPRKYKDPYFITQTVRTGNGDVVERTIGVTDNRVSGWKWVEDLKSRGDPLATGATFDVVRREDLKGAWEIADESALIRQDTSAQRMRGQVLPSIGPGGVINTRTANTLDPGKAMESSIRAIAARSSGREALEAMRTAWRKSYGAFTNGKWPAREEDIVYRKYKSLTPDDVQVARSTWNYIEQIQTGVDTIDESISNVYKKVGEVIAGTDDSGTRATLGRFVMSMPGSDNLAMNLITHPVSSVKGLAQSLYLSLNPLRQIVVQGSALLQIPAIRPQYVLGGQVVRDFTGAMMLFSSKDPKTAASLGAHRYFGVKESELPALLKAFRDAGLMEGVDQSLLVENVARASAFTRSPIRTTVKTAQALGFDAGEKLSLLVHWMTAWRRWQAQNPGRSWQGAEAAREIQSQARAISLNMNRAGKFKYNSGMLSVMMQFMSMPHKAFLAAWPKMLGGNRQFTAAEKARLAIWNSTLFGTAYVGMDQVLDQWRLEEGGWGLTESQWTAVRGGLMDWAGNRLLASWFGGDEHGNPYDIQLSRSLGPAAIAGSLADRFWPLLNDPETREIVQAIGGAGPSIFLDSNSSVRNFARDMSMFLGDSGSRKDWDFETFIAASRMTANAVPGLSNAFKYAWWTQTGKFANSDKWNPTEVEAVAQLFGFRTDKDEHFFKTLRMVGDITKSLEDDGKKIADYVIRLTDGMSPEEFASDEKYIKILTNFGSMLMVAGEGLTPDKRKVLQNSFMNRIKNRISDTSPLMYMFKRYPSMWATHSEVIIDGMNLSQEQKDNLRQLMSEMNEAVERINNLPLHSDEQK